MSQIRHRVALTAEQEPFLTVRCTAANYTSGFEIDTHTHDWHQLLFAISGAMTVYGGRWSWMIPPGKAVFIPARCSHSICMWGNVAMRSLYFSSALQAPVLAQEECRVLSVTPLMKELILRVVELRALDSRSPGHNRLAGLLLDEMDAAPVTPLMLPLPKDSRASAVARHVLTSPAGTETIDELCRQYGVGTRTLERRFRDETGISFGLWRQKARMLESIRQLAEGKSVTEAALDAGYNSVSAFIATFKRTFGATPGKI
jgi:AraC-like DNA-binding protein